MKIAAILLLVPVFALVQAQPRQIDKAQVLEQMKQSMLPMLEQSLPVMEETRACVQASNNKEDLVRCSEIMRAFQEEMMAKMAPPPGAAGQAQPPPPPPSEQQPEIEWSPEIKEQILGGLDQSIKQSTIMKGCLETSADPDAMDACIQKSGMGPRPRQ